MKEKQALLRMQSQKEDRQRTQAMVDVEEVTFEVDPLEQA